MFIFCNSVRKNVVNILFTNQIGLKLKLEKAFEII